MTKWPKNINADDDYEISEYIKNEVYYLATKNSLYAIKKFLFDLDVINYVNNYCIETFFINNGSVSLKKGYLRLTKWFRIILKFETKSKTCYRFSCSIENFEIEFCKIKLGRFMIKLFLGGRDFYSQVRIPPPSPFIKE